MPGNCYFIATSWYDGPGPSHFKELGKTLASRGNRVVFLTGQRQGVDAHDANPAVFTFPSKRPVHWQDAVFFARLVKRFRPDCLITQFAPTNIMLLVGFLYRVPVRIAWHHTMSAAIDFDWQQSQLRKNYLRLRKKVIMKLATCIVPVSQAAKADVVESFWVPEKKCVVFPNSMKDPEFHAAPGMEGRSVLCVGRLDKTKGQDTLIKAGSLLQDQFPDVTWRFIGDGMMKDDLAKLAHQYKLAANCKFLGQLAHKEVLSHMASAYVLVTPSRSEAFGLVIIEGMSVGTPVIASAVGGIPEIIRDGIDGFLVPPDDPEALAEKIIYLLKNPEVRHDMGKHARQRFLDTFEQKKVVARQIAWLEKMIAEKKTIP